MGLVVWPLKESLVEVDLVLTETSLLFIYKLLLISMRTASPTLEKQGGFYQRKVNASLTFSNHTTVNGLFKIFALYSMHCNLYLEAVRKDKYYKSGSSQLFDTT